jgi:hypothetical protein
MNLLRESSFTKDIYEKGERDGQIEQTKKIVILLGQVRFGSVDDSTCDKIDSIDDLERLEGLCEKLLHATSWADLMTEFSKHIYVDAEKRGQIKGIKKLLIRQGEVRFGRLNKATRAKIKSIDDLERLEWLCVKLLNAASWADLLNESE